MRGYNEGLAAVKPAKRAASAGCSLNAVRCAALIEMFYKFLVFTFKPAKEAKRPKGGPVPFTYRDTKTLKL